ncbi:MAG: SGNH/GDSL hydrolase family protein [Candidatus Omnitrophota bacterium]
MKKNSLWKKLAVFLFSIFLMVLFLEKIAKFKENKFCFDTRVYVQTAKPNLHRISNIPGLSYELIPNAATEDGFFKINSHGIRDREYAIPKPKNVYRIIILGDSVTFGTEYPIELTYPKLLEKKLNSNLGSEVKFEVLNAGVCAYNVIQKFILLKNKLLDYQPDLVIFQFIKDDYYRNAVILPGCPNQDNHIFINMGEYFALNFPRIIPLPENIDKSLKNHSAVYRFINKSIYDWLSLKNPDKYIPQGYRYAALGDLSESMKENKKVFQDFKSLSEAENFQFVLMLVPELKNTDSMDGWIRKSGPEKFNFKTLDLFDQFMFMGVDLVSLRIIPQGICHFNQIGHQLNSEILYSWLSANVELRPAR